MPNRLTTAGQRWIQIAQRHPSLDSTPILKLCQFAAKLESDERRLRRLTRLADNQPSGHENPRIVEARSALARTAAAKQRHQERLEWWCDRAARQGWDVAEIHAASQLPTAQVETLLADVLAEREAKAAARCDYCAKSWHEPSTYCRDEAKHRQTL